MFCLRLPSHLRTYLVAGAALLALGSSVQTQAQAGPPPFVLHDGDTVVFYGDSITDQRLYTTDVENYVVTRFPTLHVRFVHSGWGGDRVTGGGGGPIDRRLLRDVFAYKPNMVTIMLGMNDGGYHTFDQPTYDTYTQGYTHIVDSIKQTLPGVRLTLIEPSPYDDVTRPPQFDGGYNGVLVRYAQFDKDLAAKDSLGVADFNTPMVAMLQKANTADPALAQKIIPDRIHPSPAGHLVMAEALIKAWNGPSVITDVQIDAATKRVVGAKNSKVTGLAAAGKTLRWTQTDGALPLPLNADDPSVALVLKSSDFVSAMDQETLRVSGLSAAASYTLLIDDHEISNFTTGQFAAGVNLALLDTPMTQQAAQVANLTTKHNDLHFRRWRSIQVPLEQDATDAITQALPPLLAALDAQEAEIVTQQQAAAVPIVHRYQLVPALPQPAGPNLALGKPYTTSAPNQYGFGTDALTDGSWEDTGVHTFATDDRDTFPKTATIDLGAVSKLSSVRVGMPPFGSTKTVQVSVSADGQTFTPVGSYVFTQNHAERHLYRFAPVTGRYVRLTYSDHYDAGAGYNTLFSFTSEVEVYGP